MSKEIMAVCSSMLTGDMGQLIVNMTHQKRGASNVRPARKEEMTSQLHRNTPRRHNEILYSDIP